jgi:uncharacterized damage-inducible protein DinB
VSFQVEPDELRTFGARLGGAASDAGEANTYIKRYAEFGWHEKGLINHLRTAHEDFINELTSGLAHLKDLLEKSKTELTGAAAYYEKTDTAAASRLDNSYPQTPRPMPNDQH